ncbi:MAG: AN1-type zinc finger domain-containing protein [Candidatus Heimdallarchaeaceae archaeon]
MRKCAVTGCEEDMSLPFKCKLCGQYYCAKHRLPEQHDCPGVHVFQTEEYKHAKVSILSTKKKDEKELKKTLKKAKKTDKKQKKNAYLNNEMYYPNSKRFLMYSSFFTIFSLKNIWLNILIASGYLTFIFIGHLLIYFLISKTPVFQPLFLWALITTVVALNIIYTGHWIVQFYAAQKERTVVHVVHWLQGMLFGLIGLILPFILIPSYLTFPSVFLSSNENRGKTALAGISWMLVTTVLTTILARFVPIPDAMSLGLTFVPFMFFIYMFFDLFPFGLSKGTYILAWDKKVYWGTFGAIFIMFLFHIIITSI